MFLVCPTEMLPTLRLKIGRPPVLRESVQVRSIMFTTGWFQVRLVSVASLSGGGVLVPNQDRMGSFSRQNRNSVGQDGKHNKQAIEIHRTVSRWAEPVWMQSQGSVKHQTCLIFYQSTMTSRETTTDPNRLCKHCSRPSINT